MKGKIPKNPGLAYAKGVQDGQTKGIFIGFDAYVMLTLLALDNVYEEHFEDFDKAAEFVRAWDDEMTRIMKTEFNEDIENMAEKVEYHLDKLMQKYKMGEYREVKSDV